MTRKQILESMCPRTSALTRLTRRSKTTMMMATTARPTSVVFCPRNHVVPQQHHGRMFFSSLTKRKNHVSQRSSTIESFKVMDILQQANHLESQEGKDVLHCEVGQPETGAPSSVAQAAIDALQEPQVMGYTDSFGLLALRSKIAQHYQNHYGSKLKDEQVPSTSRIVVTTGSSGAFLLAFTACFDPGDVVAIASAGYPCYRNILSALGCELAHVNVNDEFKLTATEMRAEMKRRAALDEKPIKGIILSSPSNPTGAMLTPDELQDLCRLCDDHDVQFLSDEIYHGISYGKEEATALQFSSRPIIINSFSKFYSMSGWRLGWMVIPDDLIDPINSLQQNMFINAPTISQTAALKCWDDDTLVELNQHVEKYKTSRALILDELTRLPGLDPRLIAPADGGFYVYVDLGPDNVALSSQDGDDDQKKPSCLLGSVAMCQALLEEHYVAFTPGIDFEDPSTGLGNVRFRISYAGGIETAAQAMKRFHEFWPSWQERVRRAKKEETAVGAKE